MTTVVQAIENPTRMDRVVDAVFRAANRTKVGWSGARGGPLRMSRFAKRYPWIEMLGRVNELHDTMTRGRSGLYREANAYLISSLVSAIGELIVGLVQKPDRTVMSEDLVPPQILRAMGLHAWTAEFLGIVLPLIEPTFVEPYIDIAESTGIAADTCSLPKSTVGLVLDGKMPQPIALVTSNMPCDGGMSQYTLIQRELRVPTFRLDVPHNFHSERAIDYFVGQLERLIAWLEAHTPGRMDWDRMRQICEERNRAMEYELDLWDLIRNRPAPMAAEPIYLAHLLFGISDAGTTRATRVFKRMFDLARRNLDAGVSALEDERYRVALWNPPTVIAIDLFAWAEQAYGAALIMDMISFHRQPFIDSSTPRTMLRGLAQMIMQGPMARHTRGPAENYFSDLFYFYEHFDLDMIWMAAHIGCKNTQALSGMFREKCRERGIPLLFIDYDLSDTRIVSPAGIRRQVEQFMETVMKAERIMPPGPAERAERGSR
jgi:hypothetical protein